MTPESDYNFEDDFRKSIDYCYEELRKQPPQTWPRVLNPHSGTGAIERKINE